MFFTLFAGLHVLLLSASDPCNGDCTISDALLQTQQLRQRPPGTSPLEEDASPADGAADGTFEEEAPLLIEGEANETAEGACDQLLVRFSELGDQDLRGDPDPEFPHSIESIGKAGGACGDTAAQIHAKCDKYNHWASFHSAVAHYGNRFEVMAAAGPEFDDVAQGSLGTCFFLAAVASLAHSNPELLQGMFVNRDKWSEGVYTTRWFVNGRVGNVEVDDSIPVGPSGRPWFVKPSSTGEWWPVILEKAWAKIFGSFMGVEAGKWENAVEAMTMAPVEQHYHRDVPADEIFAKLQEATAKGWPMGAGTNSQTCGKYGLSRKHAYSVLNVSRHAEYGDVVTLYNPWSHDRYRGAVPNADTRDGTFTMTLAEYHDAMSRSSLGKVDKGNKLTTKAVQTERWGMSAWEVSMAEAGTLYATLAWPGMRIVRPCYMSFVVAHLVAVRKGSMEPLAVAPTRAALFSSSVTLELNASAGDYVILAGVEFSRHDRVHEAHLALNSVKNVSVEESSEGAASLLAGVFGAVENGTKCNVVSVKSEGVFKLSLEKLVRGFPTYWSTDERSFLYWNGGKAQWYSLPSFFFDWVKSGTRHGMGSKKAKEDLSCGCADVPDADGVPGFYVKFNCSRVTEESFVFGCQNPRYSAQVQRYCPLACGAAFCQGSS